MRELASRPSRAIRVAAESANRSLRRWLAPDRRSMHAAPRGVPGASRPGKSTSTWYSYERYGPSTSRMSSSAVADVLGSARLLHRTSAGARPDAPWHTYRASRGTMVSARTAVLSPLAKLRRYSRSPSKRASSNE